MSVHCSNHRRRMDREDKAKVVAFFCLRGRIYSISCRASCFASVDLEEKIELSKQTRRPFPLLLSPSFFYGSNSKEKPVKFVIDEY